MANITPLMSNYAKKMAHLSARIFAEVSRPTGQSSMKVVTMFRRKPVDLDPEIVNFYPPHTQMSNLMWELRKHGLYRDEHEDFKEEMKRLRALRGKAKRPKGEGKRASLNK